MSHTCHAADCKCVVKPEMLMCYRHWKMVPYNLQKRIWATYREGQCDDWRPSAEYCDAAQSAVAEKEGKRLTSDHPALKLYDVFRPQD